MEIPDFCRTFAKQLGNKMSNLKYKDMAKYGKFVGRECLMIHNEERNAIKEHFCKLVNGLWIFSKIGLPFDKVETLGQTLYVHFVCPTIKKRNGFGDRITFEGLYFAIRKQTGYLDKTDWLNHPTEIVKDYDNAPEYQYECYMYAKGTEIPYRYRNVTGIFLEEHFDYDTEYNNFTFYKALNQLKRKLE